MKSFKAGLISFLTVFAITNPPSYAQMQCICHSKQPAMRRMHETLGMSGCGNCHTKNENLMSKKGEKDPKADENLARRAIEDRSCVPCHDSRGSIKKEIRADQKAVVIAGTLYCPKDKMRFSSDSRTCSKCGGILLNIDELMAKSRTDPSDDICRECHWVEEVQQIKQHTMLNANRLKKCLDCHQGHDDCGSCHH